MLWLLLFQNVAESEHKKLESKLCWSPKPESEKQKILWPSTPPLHGIVKKTPPMTSWGWLQKRVIQTPVKIRSFKAEQEPYCQISWGGGDSLYQERSGALKKILDHLSKSENSSAIEENWKISARADHILSLSDYLCFIEHLLLIK